MATDGIPTLASPATNTPGTLVSPVGLDRDRVGGDRVRRRQPQAELGGEVAALMQHGGYEQATAGSLGAVGEADRRQLVARAVDFDDAPFVDSDAGDNQMIAVLLGEARRDRW